MMQDSPSPGGRSKEWSFYQIVHHADGIVDLYLTPFQEEPGLVFVVQGLQYTEGMEDEIRHNYYAYLDVSEVIR